MLLSLTPWATPYGTPKTRGQGREKLGTPGNILTVNKEFSPQTTSWNKKRRKQVSGS